MVESGRQRNEFLAMLAHELRNPLAAISNAMQLWKRPDANEAAITEAQRILER
jgi:two-component system CheB/CheR fusion protein